MNIRVLVNIVSPLALSALLAACGGGGSTSSVIPGGGGGTTTAALRAGFIGIGPGGTQSIIRRVQSVRGEQAVSALIVPTADFIIAPNWVTPAPFTLNSATALAYFDTSGGATAPSPLPSIAWTTTGDPVTLGAPALGGTLTNGSPIISSVLVPLPTLAGQGTITGTVSTGGSISLTFNAYKGTGMSSFTGNGYGLQPCITVNADGSTTPSATGDLCLTVLGDGSSSLVAVRGAVVVQKAIDGVSSSDVVSLPSTSTAIPSTSLGSGTATVVAGTAIGKLVKWEPVGSLSYGGQNLANGLYGPYRVASGAAPTASWDF